LGLGQVEIDTSYVDYYLAGEIAALDDYNSKSFLQTGCLFSYFVYPMILIVPIKIPLKHNLTLVDNKLYPSKMDSSESELFQDGYKNQIRRLRLQDTHKGIIFRVLITYAANGLFERITGSIILH
tara:strand:+ start:322 stop:696 length:375 start_codon:yes stop_codon:yes gene_type:complete